MAFLLHHLLEGSARQHPDRPAVAFADRSLSYQELDRAANGFAQLLREIGVTESATVGVHMRRSIEALVAMLGTLKAGSAYVPLDPQSPTGRLRYIAELCHIEVVATVGSQLDVLDEALLGMRSVARVVLMDDANPGRRPGEAPELVYWGMAVADDPPPAATIDADPAYVLFTSGSTGAPKGVVISHLNAVTFVEAAAEVLGIQKEDRLSHVCPLQSDMSVLDIYVALRAGACIVGISEVTAMFPAALGKAIQDNEITIWNSVPSALTGLASIQSVDVPTLRTVIFAGEPFPFEPLRQLMAAIPQARFCNMYGQTEANSSTYHWVGDLSERPREPIPIGRALPNFEVFVLGTDGKQVVEPGGEGELHVRSSTVALGYWGDPGGTARAFITDPRNPHNGGRVYRTRDVVRIAANGDLVFVGRKDLLIKSRGYRVEIEEVEGAIRNHPAVMNAAVIAVPDERIGNRLAAFVQPESRDGLTKEDVIAHCIRELPHYMIPEEITICEAIPLTPLGKIDRKRLEQA